MSSSSAANIQNCLRRAGKIWVRIWCKTMSKTRSSDDIQQIIFCLIIIFLTFAAFVFNGCSTRKVYHVSGEIAVPSAISNSVNINTASARELESLPQIGPETAKKIIEFRTENGPFLRPENLMLIRGISEKRFLEIRQFVKTE